MDIQLHLPRKSEATVSPSLAHDVIITPKFYKKTGWASVFYVTTIDATGNEDRYVLSVNAANMQLRMEKLVEVIPACDEQRKQKKINDTSTSNTPVENEDVRGTVDSQAQAE